MSRISAILAPARPRRRHGAWLTLEVYAVLPGGRERLVHRQPGHSWVKQWVRMLECRNRNATVSAVVDTAGVSRNLSTTGINMGAGNAGIGVDSHGILVGASDAAPGRDDFSMGAKIAEGAGPGQLNYGAMAFGPAGQAITGGYRVVLSRQVNNNSGAEITVREIGYVGLHTTTEVAERPFLVLHDLVAPAVAIPNGESRVFKYNLDFLA